MYATSHCAVIVHPLYYDDKSHHDIPGEICLLIAVYRSKSKLWVLSRLSKSSMSNMVAIPDSQLLVLPYMSFQCYKLAALDTIFWQIFTCCNALLMPE